MPFRYFGEEAAEHRTQPAGQRVYHAALFANLHDAQPKGKNARQSQGYFKCRFEEVNVELTSSVKISVLPMNKSLMSATMKAIMKNATQM